MTEQEKKQNQQHRSIAKTTGREAKIAAAIERMGAKGFTALVDRLLEIEEKQANSESAPVRDGAKAQEA